MVDKQTERLRIADNDARYYLIFYLDFDCQQINDTLRQLNTEVDTKHNGWKFLFFSILRPFANKRSKACSVKIKSLALGMWVQKLAKISKPSSIFHHWSL